MSCSNSPVTDYETNQERRDPLQKVRGVAPGSLSPCREASYQSCCFVLACKEKVLLLNTEAGGCCQRLTDHLGRHSKRCLGSFGESNAVLLRITDWGEETAPRSHGAGVWPVAGGRELGLEQAPFRALTQVRKGRASQKHAPMFRCCHGADQRVTSLHPTLLLQNCFCQVPG